MIEELIEEFEKILDECIETMLKLEILPKLEEVKPNSDLVEEFKKLHDIVNKLL
ncbi:MAG: hypothetical protein LBR15_00665 [Methanobrevibacter sp.]|jgi:hypothetical protein|nr:hypothetical protein [Candidatus Methanovirga australis]